MEEVAPQAKGDALQEAGEEESGTGEDAEGTRVAAQGPTAGGQGHDHEEHTEAGESLAGVPPARQVLDPVEIVLKEPGAFLQLVEGFRGVIIDL